MDDFPTFLIDLFAGTFLAISMPVTEDLINIVIYILVSVLTKVAWRIIIKLNKKKKL